MRLILEIIIGGLLITFLLTTFTDKQNTEDKLEDSRGKVEMLKDSNNILEDSLRGVEDARDSIVIKSDSLEKEIDNITSYARRIQEAYTDSLEAIQETKLSELIDSSRIIIKGSKTFVLVSEEYYRQARVNEVDLERLKSLVGVYRNKIESQEELIEVKDEEIMNLMHQVSIYKHKSSLKDSIITEKDFQVDMKDKQIRKYKLQRNIAGGAIIGTIILILL